MSVPTDREATARPPERIFTRPFVALVGAHFLQALGYASLLLLPLYLAYLGSSRTQIGVFIAISSVSGLLARPLVGFAIDTIGRRITLSAGTLLMASGLLLIYGVTETGPLLVASRLLCGAGEAALFTGYFVFAADIVPASRRTEGIAIFGISGLIPIIVGPLVDRAGLSASSLRFFLPAVGLAVTASLVLLWSVPEQKVARDRAPFSPRLALRTLIAPPLLPVWLATALFSGLVAVFMAFVTVVAARRGVAHPASLWFAYAGAAAFVRTVGARLPDRLGPSNLVVPAIGCYLAALLVSAGAWSGPAFLLAGTLAGIGHGYGFPVLIGQAVDRTPESLRGTSLALYTALWAASALLLTPALGAIADAHDDATMFSVAALGGVLALASWAVLEHRTHAN